ncbi:hypothetical protein GCM10010172_85340 [Paractinoplanes ferrugineus]|uniref:Uncharacterized protein n=1 Tax=Paractinoplanes ferrugineus TaxID=113564 RepID=A0A919MHT1_9ACTN|nr:hypothetical protein Afe05nite_71140 [Actinoplanes ferrugineus]
MRPIRTGGASNRRAWWARTLRADMPTRRASSSMVYRSATGGIAVRSGVDVVAVIDPPGVRLPFTLRPPDRRAKQ